MKIEGTRLPGVGVRYDLATERGDALAVIVADRGGGELVLYDRADPDACRVAVSLTDGDARRLRDLLDALARDG